MGSNEAARVYLAYKRRSDHGAVRGARAAVDGRNIVIDSRSAQSDFDQLRQAAREFASMKVNVNRRVRLNRNARCSASYVDNSNCYDSDW